MPNPCRQRSFWARIKLSISEKSKRRRRRRRHPVDSIIDNLKDFVGEETHASHGKPSVSKIMFRSYCAARFPKSRRKTPPIFVTPLTLHRFPAFASEERCFFHWLRSKLRMPMKKPCSKMLNYLLFLKRSPWTILNNALQMLSHPVRRDRCLNYHIFQSLQADSSIFFDFFQFSCHLTPSLPFIRDASISAIWIIICSFNY